MAATKKTLEQQIEEAEAKLKELKAKQKEKVLEKTSPGMDQLLAAIEAVKTDNDCSVFDILRSVSRIKKTGATLIPAVKKKKETNTTDGEVTQVKTTKTAKTGQAKKS